MKRKPKHTNKRILIAVATVVVILVAAVGAYLLVKNYRDKNSRPYTYFDCVEDFGTTGDNPPKCFTDDGDVYVEFKVRGKSYEECASEGGKATPDGLACVDQERKYIEKFPDSVSSYNECQDTYPRWRIASLQEPEACVDKYGFVRIAGGPGRTVNDYEACVKAGGVEKNISKPRVCYYEGVVYHKILKPSHKYLNPPYELKTYLDCMQNLGEKITSNSSCKSPLGLTFYYEGDPPIRNYEECLPIQGSRLDINLPGPDKCIGPDGTIFTESE
jgi:hypothetical protein